MHMRTLHCSAAMSCFLLLAGYPPGSYVARPAHDKPQHQQQPPPPPAQQQQQQQQRQGKVWYRWSTPQWMSDRLAQCGLPRVPEPVRKQDFPNSFLVRGFARVSPGSLHSLLAPWDDEAVFLHRFSHSMSCHAVVDVRVMAVSAFRALLNPLHMHVKLSRSSKCV
jgi:hypothetical protein